MIQVPKRHASEVVDWLDQNVSPNRPNLAQFSKEEITEESRMNPWSVSATAMRATWQALDGSWMVMQSSRRAYIEVACQDMRIETYIATRWA